MKLWIAGVVAAAIAIIAVIAVIAVGSDDAERPEGAPPGAPEPAAMQAFQDCMEENGAALPETPTGAVMIEPDESTRRALEECQELMPAPPGQAEPGFSPPPEN